MPISNYFLPKPIWIALTRYAATRRTLPNQLIMQIIIERLRWEGYLKPKETCLHNNLYKGRTYYTCEECGETFRIDCEKSFEKQAKEIQQQALENLPFRKAYNKLKKLKENQNTSIKNQEFKEISEEYLKHLHQCKHEWVVLKYVGEIVCVKCGLRRDEEPI